MEIFTCAAWNLWKERNDLILRNIMFLWLLEGQVPE
jgi:hypothetical protein